MSSLRRIECGLGAGKAVYGVCRFAAAFWRTGWDVVDRMSGKTIGRMPSQEEDALVRWALILLVCCSSASSAALAPLDCCVAADTMRSVLCHCGACGLLSLDSSSIQVTLQAYVEGTRTPFGRGCGPL